MSQVPFHKRIEQRLRPAHAQPVMYQKWRNLLFLHWTFDPFEVQKTLPKGLYVDTFEGKAYIGIVPFFMRDVRPRLLPAVSRISNFLELNLRTYAYDNQGIPGIWFYSLDASNWIAVKVARAFFGLPYFYSRMRAEHEIPTNEISFSSKREGFDTDEGIFFRYRGFGQSTPAQPGSLEFFLIERYVLFTDSKNRLWKGKVHHPPYPLMEVEVSAWDDSLFQLDGINRPGRPPDHCLISQGVDVEVYPLEELDG